MIRKINFPKTSNKYFLNLENKCFDFCNNGKPANIVVFIGRNGSGKSSLLNKIFINLCYEKRNISLKIVEKIQEVKEIRRLTIPRKLKSEHRNKSI